MFHPHDHRSCCSMSSVPLSVYNLLANKKSLENTLIYLFTQNTLSKARSHSFVHALTRSDTNTLTPHHSAGSVMVAGLMATGAQQIQMSYSDCSSCMYIVPSLFYDLLKKILNWFNFHFYLNHIQLIQMYTSIQNITENQDMQD